MKNYIQRGDVITLTAPADVKSGEIVIVGGLAGVAAFDAKSGESVEVSLVGVFALPKAAGVVLAAGVPAAYSTGDKNIAATGTAIGDVVRAAAADDPVVHVRISGYSGAAITGTSAP